MMNVRILALASLGVTLGADRLAAQEPFRYRDYVLESTVASVVESSGSSESATKTLHDRPAIIQQLEWRAPYMLRGSTAADPVSRMQFSFYDDQLYRIVVTYDRDRMEGLTNEDVIESLAAIYGTPLVQNVETVRTAIALGVSADVVLVAQWDTAETLLTLTRSTYWPQFQLELISTKLSARAAAATTEARRLDARDAPQRELDRRRQEADDAQTAADKARVVNKAAFRP